MNDLSSDIINAMNNFFINSDSDVEIDVNTDFSVEPDNIIKKFIKQMYEKYLNREPDIDGLEHYFNMLSRKAITGGVFVEILTNSKEYKDRIIFNENIHKKNIDDVFIDNQILKIKNDNKMRDNESSKEITYCMIGTNKLHEIKNYIEKVLSYVDKFIYIDGGSNDGTAEYFNNLNNESIYSGKIEFYTYIWKDEFSAQRNNYLNKLKERNYKGWVLVSDTDEHFIDDTIINLKNIMNMAEDNGYNGVKFRVEDIIIHDVDSTDNKITSNVNNYWKLLFYRYYSDLKYEGEPHETLTGVSIKPMTIDYLYTHTRSQRKIYERATENFFISNSNRFSDKWSDFRFLCTCNNILSFKDFFDLFKIKKLPKDIEDWIYNHKDVNEDSGDSEIREMAKLYFEIITDEIIVDENVIDDNVVDENVIDENVVNGNNINLTFIPPFISNNICECCGKNGLITSIKFIYHSNNLNLCDKCWKDLGVCIRNMFGD